MTASMVRRSLAYDEHTLSGTRLDYARVCVDLDASLPMVHVFQLRCRLSTKSIIITIDYEWKPTTCEIYKVFSHSCKASVEAPTILVEDMFKIKNGGDALYACCKSIEQRKTGCS